MIILKHILKKNSLGLKSEFKKHETTETADNFKFDNGQITVKGSPNHPAWVFEV